MAEREMTTVSGRNGIQQPLLLQQENVDEELIRERNREMARLADDLQGLRDISQDLNRMAMEQGIILDQANTQTQQGDQNVTQAVAELRQADVLAAKRRKKIVCIIIIILAILAIIATILILKYTKKSN